MKTAHALALAAAFAAESALFLVVTSHHYAWIYPRWFDQDQYLRQAYDAYEQARRIGFAGAAWHALTLNAAQGALHGFLALLVFAVAGPSRGAALAVNLLAFLALQAATFLAARRISGSFAIAWAAVALVAAVHFPWSGGPASAIDFRLDWMAACAYGVALAVALAGNGFRSTRWAALFGVAVGGVVLTRFLTAVYFTFIFAALLAWLALGRDRWRRIGRAVLSGAVAAAICGPALWRSRGVIYSYYWIGHFAGPERELRESHLGALSSARWFLYDMLFVQVGLPAALLGLGAAAAFLVLGSLRKTREESPAPPGFPPGSSWAPALVFLGAPAAVLALHPEKSSPAESILIPGAVWVIILGWQFLARRARRGAVAAVCGAVALAGAVLFVAAETRKAHPDGMVAKYRKVNALCDYLYFRAEESGLAQPSVAVTWIVDSLDSEAFSIVGYERHHRPLRFIATLPSGLLATTREAVMQGLAASDFVCLVTRAAAMWPFDRQMEDMLPDMRRWCDANLEHVGDLDTVDVAASVYERPKLARLQKKGGVVFSEMVEAGMHGAPYAGAVPPAPPVFLSPIKVLGSTKADFRYPLEAAHSPVSFAAEGLPEGLHLVPETGEIRGGSQG